MLKENRKFLFIIMMVLLISFTVYFLLKYEIKVDSGHELVKSSPPLISFMIFRDASDQEIINKIDEDPSLIHEECSGCNSIDFQTPLITAILYKRDSLIKYLIEKGASIEDAVYYLKTCSHCKSFIEYLENILEETDLNSEDSETLKMM